MEPTRTAHCSVVNTKELQAWEVAMYIDKTDVAVGGGGGDNHTQNQFLPHRKHGSPSQEQSVCYVLIISPYCTVLYCIVLYCTARQRHVNKFQGCCTNDRSFSEKNTSENIRTRRSSWCPESTVY